LAVLAAFLNKLIQLAPMSGVSACRLNSFGVIETMVDVMVERGVPEHFRSDKVPR
jgi:hypothetical protein